MVRILVLSFLFKGESFSFVRGLWLLNLNNRKIFLWIFSGSTLHLMFFSGDWEASLFLEFRILSEILSFFRIIVLSTRGRLQTLAFLQGFLNSLGLDVFCIKGFSLASMISMISSCYFSVVFDFFS